MAVVGVLAEADVADDAEVGVGVLEGAHRLLDDAVGGVGLRCRASSFAAGRPKSSTAGTPQVAQLARLGRELVERELVLAGHRRDLVADAAPVGDEQRVDEVARVQPRLGDEAAQGLAAAQTPEALEGGREAGRGGHCLHQSTSV